MAQVEALLLDVPPDPLRLYEALAPAHGGFALCSGGGPRDVSRYSFVGGEPEAVLAGSDLGALQRWLDGPRLAHDPALPPFQCGAVGFIAYDAGRGFERLPATARDDLATPTLRFGLHDTIVAIDGWRSRVWLLQAPGLGSGAALERKRRDWVRRLRAGRRRAPAPWAAGSVTSNFTREAYLAAVGRARAYIRAGDIFQVNLAQRFEAALQGDPWELFVRLSRSNPAPFAAYLEAGEFRIASSSPERLLSLRPSGDGRLALETRPIKGTVARGADGAAAARQLLRSRKDEAELRMIIDLARNDLGRVCEFGSIRVPERRRLEAHPGLLHTVGVVRGLARAGVGPFAALRAVFPGASVTGAPKIRAMEIIEELEPVRRGVYTGAIGYFGLSGAADLSIAIRTMVLRGGRVLFHAGGAVVADSDPSAEYAETLAKVRRLLGALGGEGRGG